MIDEVLYMEARIIRQFCQKYDMAPKAVNELFEKFQIWDYIESCYDSLHTAGDEYVLSEISDILRGKGFMLFSIGSIENKIFKSRNTCADMILADAIEDYAREENLSRAEARSLILNSKAYECLYDFETNLWMEGPDYFIDFFRKCSIA